MGKFLGDWRWGAENGVLSTKAAISPKRVKIDKKLLWRAYRNLPTLFRTVPSPIPYGLLFPKIEGSHPQPKLQIAAITILRNANLADTFTGSTQTKAH